MKQPSFIPAVLPTNDDPTRQIRFSSPEEAAARRQKLIQFIWGDSLPDSLPTVIENVDKGEVKEHLEGLDHSLVSGIDKLELNVLGLKSFFYLIHPKTPSDTPRLGIVHAGHSPLGSFIKRDYTDSIHLYLKLGFTAAMIHMPQRGWNDAGTAVLPNGTTVDVSSADNRNSHGAIVNLPVMDSSLPDGAGFRPFLEPVIGCINHWVNINDKETEVVMIGLSGGGWTTHMASALDPRVLLSFPVAGSYPLYLRNRAEKAGTVGDLEQVMTGLYDEDIAPDGSGGGAATWLEIYALGGFGEGRRQVMITAQHDSCCFEGDPEKTVDTFKNVVADKVKELGQGQWEHRLDTTHEDHMISPWVLDEVITPIVRDFCI